MEKGQRVKDAVTGKMGTVEKDLVIFLLVRMDDGELRNYAPGQLRCVEEAE